MENLKPAGSRAVLLRLQAGLDLFFFFPLGCFGILFVCEKWLRARRVALILISSRSAWLWKALPGVTWNWEHLAEVAARLRVLPPVSFGWFLFISAQF